ncbi:MAG: hypothetical protein ABH874_08230 [Methanobacteriota archaeon]
MNYWFHSNFWTDYRSLEPLFEENIRELEFYMITKTGAGNWYPNIHTIKEGDKIIFLQNLVAIGSGKIKLVEMAGEPKFLYKGEKYPLRITYTIKPFKNHVKLRDPEVIKFLQNVRFENSRHGTFLAKSKNAVKILPKRLAATYQRINEEIYDEIIRRSSSE